MSDASNYRAHFRDLWERINGEGSWAAIAKAEGQ